MYRNFFLQQFTTKIGKRLTPSLVFCGFVFVFVIFGSGCEKKQAKPYKRESLTLIQNAVEQLNKSKNEDAINSLQKLYDLNEDVEFYAVALKRETNRKEIIAFNKCITEGNFASAKKIIDDGINAEGTSFALYPYRELPKALQLLHSIHAKEPYKKSNDLKIALANLKPYKKLLLESSPNFSKWYNRQEKQLLSLVALEKQQKLDGLVAIYNERAVSSPNECEAVFAQISAIDNNYILIRLCQAANDKDWPLLRKLLKGTAQAKSFGAAVTAVAPVIWQMLPSNLQKKYPLPHGQVATTPAGLLLQAYLAFDKNNIDLAKKNLLSLQKKIVIADTYKEYLLEKELLPRNQFVAECWQTPFPSIVDLLNRITHVESKRR